jgi:hypothetical protein
MKRPLYEHTQVGWMLRGSFALAVLVFLVLGTLQQSRSEQWPAALVPLGFLTAAMVLGWFWAKLSVQVDDVQVRLWFGLGWPRRTLRLADIVSVEVTRTSILAGWGMHRATRGWLYNVQGFDAVIVGLTDGKSVLIGSDEPRRLKAAIERARDGAAGGRARSS